MIRYHYLPDKPRVADPSPPLQQILHEHYMGATPNVGGNGPLARRGDQNFEPPLIRQDRDFIQHLPKSSSLLGATVNRPRKFRAALQSVGRARRLRIPPRSVRTGAGILARWICLEALRPLLWRVGLKGGQDPQDSIQVVDTFGGFNAPFGARRDQFDIRPF